MEITLTCLCLRDSSLVKSTKPFNSDIALEIGNRNLCKPSYCTSWSHKQLIEYGVTFVIVWSQKINVFQRKHYERNYPF